MRAHRGFTLIELMVVVAIIGLLASMTVPSLNGVLMRARRSEVKIILRGIDVAMQDAYSRNESRFPAFITRDAMWPFNPAPFDPTTLSPTDGECAFPAPAAWTMSSPEWTWLGFQPEGRLRARYTTLTENETNGGYVIWSLGDLDNNGVCTGHAYGRRLSPTGNWYEWIEGTIGASGSVRSYSDDGEW